MLCQTTFYRKEIWDILAIRGVIFVSNKRVVGGVASYLSEIPMVPREGICRNYGLYLMGRLGCQGEPLELDVRVS